MTKFLLIALSACLFFPGSPAAQYSRKLDSLVSLYTSAINDSDKIITSGRLAEYYYIYQLDKKGDSVLQLQLKAAELSQNKNLLFAVFFGSPIMNISTWAKKESFDRALQFLKKGLEYSKSMGREDYVALSYIRMASLYRKRADLDNAFYHANIAFTTSQNIEDDSIKILAAIELGNVYQARGESLLAFKSYTTAFDQSEDIGNINLQTEVYHRLSELYQSLRNDLAAKEYLLKSLEQNIKYNNTRGQIKDYIDLARLTDDRLYIEKALSLSESLNLDSYIIQAKGIMYGYYTAIVANSDSTMLFLENNPDLTQTWKNIGLPFYYLNIGSVYHYAKKPDSALYYLKLAAPGFEKDFNPRNLQTLYEETGDCYVLLQQVQPAIYYYEMALALNNQINSPVNAARYSNILGNLYGQIPDYKKAYYYLQQSAGLKDSLQKLAGQRDITLMEVNNEKKRHERELERIAEQKLTKRNLQYMAITILITIFFFLLIIIGMLPVSKVTVKLLGYFTFISLFEFIILLVDPFLHRITHGEPLKIWIAKIFLIAVLVPVQHYLEHGLTHFLATRKKNNIFSIKKWWQRPKRPATGTIDKIEEDTAVL